MKSDLPDILLVYLIAALLVVVSIHYAREADDLVVAWEAQVIR